MINWLFLVNSLINTVHDQANSKNTVIVKYIHWGATDIYSSNF